MEIQKIAEEIGKKNGFDLKMLVDGVMMYAGMMRDAIHGILGHRPGEGKIYDLAMVALIVTTPILVIKPLVKFAIKLVALSALSALILGRIYPLPPEQLIPAALIAGFGLLIIIRVFKK